MKNLVLILILGISINLFSQELSGVKIARIPEYTENSEISVVYKNSQINQHNGKNPAYFVNEIHIENETAIKSINPKKIESINVEKGNLEIKGKEYYGKINIITKENYKPNFITLEKLAEKYLSTETNPRIFQIDETIIDSNEKEYLVDENYILKIELTKIKNPKLNSDVDFIKLVTKTPENIKKANQIMIRGNEI
ncbi:hypothetical protein PG279_10020 [Riemerella anatipestifer]|nr:hypothetical protein [Riemerella anatipestifer]